MARGPAPKVRSREHGQITILAQDSQATPREGCGHQMSSALAHSTRTGSWLRLGQTVAAISLLFGGAALAQTANGGGVQSAKVQAAYADWRRLSQTEVNCVDQSLRGQRTSLWSLIQRGIEPSDPTLARLRAACRAQARAPNISVAAQSGSQAQAAAVESTLVRAVTDKAAADKAAADRAAADKAAADKVAAEKVAADKAAAKAAADKVAADKAAAEQAAAEQAAIESAKAETERAKADAIKAQAIAEPPRPEAEKTSADAVVAYAAAEARMSFIYGLISSPICFGVGGLVFLWVVRRRQRAVAPPDASAPDRASRRTQREFDRLVTAVLAEVKRREAKQFETNAAEPGKRIDESVLY
jgi:chemotaxis protein histidine kinase CheA